jgi:hypothetical protein
VFPYPRSESSTATHERRSSLVGVQPFRSGIRSFFVICRVLFAAPPLTTRSSNYEFFFFLTVGRLSLELQTSGYYRFPAYGHRQPRPSPLTFCGNDGERATLGSTTTKLSRVQDAGTRGGKGIECALGGEYSASIRHGIVDHCLFLVEIERRFMFQDARGIGRWKSLIVLGLWTTTQWCAKPRILFGNGETPKIGQCDVMLNFELFSFLCGIAAMRLHDYAGQSHRELRS